LFKVGNWLCLSERFFFWVLSFKYSGSVAGLQYGLGKTESIFSGEKDFRFASPDFPTAGGVWGGMRAGLALWKSCLRKRIVLQYTYLKFQCYG